MSQPLAGQIPVETVPAAMTAGTPGRGAAQLAGRPAEAGLPATGDVVLDASFVIALLQRDPAAGALAHVLRRGVMTSVTAGEVFAAIAEAGGPGPERVEGVLRALGVRIVDLPLAAGRQFPKLRAIDAARRVGLEIGSDKAAALSLGDLSVLGYALVAGAPVVAGGRQWTNLEAHGLAVTVHCW